MKQMKRFATAEQKMNVPSTKNAQSKVFYIQQQSARPGNLIIIWAQSLALSKKMVQPHK